MMVGIIVIFLLIYNIINDKTDQELRIRVIANSDSQTDQEEKNLVVKRLTKLIRDLSEENQDEENIINKIKSNIDLIDENLSKHFPNLDYSIKITNVNFPTKELDSKIIPGGKCQTLLVVIGSGSGKNWWSLLNPSYHNINFDDLKTGEVEFKSYFFNR